MKPKHDIYISFGVKGARVDVGCVTLYYGEGQENEMIGDFERYLSEPEEMEKLYANRSTVSVVRPGQNELPSYAGQEQPHSIRFKGNGI